MVPAGRPRGRPRKVGNTRIDAAWDALRPYGFTKYMVVKTVKELLEVYGEGGWPFIEDSSYLVLLDAILLKVEKREKKKNEMECASASSTLAAETILGITCPAACCDDEDEPLIGQLQVTEVPGSAAQASNKYVHPEQPGGSDMKQRRRPYHGWISNDWEEEDLVELKPGPLAEKVAKLLLENVHEKRKRWDREPQDM